MTENSIPTASGTYLTPEIRTMVEELNDYVPVGEDIKLHPDQELPLNGFIESLGHHRETGVYVWKGLERQNEGPKAAIQYTLSGTGLLDFKGKRLTVKPGQAMLVFYPHQHRYMLPLEQDEWHFIFINVTGEAVIKMWRWLIQENGPVIDLLPDSHPVGVILEILRRASAGGIENDAQCAALAHRLTFSMVNHYIQAVREPEVPKGVRIGRKYIEANYASPLTLENIAKAAGYSASRLSSLFRKHLGETPRAYMEHIRLKRAQTLLASSDFPLDEIATACGFQNANYFGKVFRARMKTTPMEYRRRASL